MSSDEERDVFVTVRMPQSLRKELADTASESERTLAGEIRLACQTWLARRRERSDQTTA